MGEKILVVDDEKDIVKFIKDFLIINGYVVITAFNGEEALEKVSEKPDLILLDIMMPDIDGYSVCKKIRDSVICPIIFLSALRDEANRIKGLTTGGDDFIIKPFSLKELKARIDAHLRREKRSIVVNKKMVVNFKNLSIDLKGREIYCKDVKIRFTRREFDIIELLCAHPGMVYSKELIYENIWGYDAEGDSSSVTEHIKRIRSKLSIVDKDTEYIVTVWSVGYKWSIPK